MVKRYGDKALEESHTRVDEFAAPDNYHGKAKWRRIIEAVGQLVNKTSPGALY